MAEFGVPTDKVHDEYPTGDQRGMDEGQSRRRKEHCKQEWKGSLIESKIRARVLTKCNGDFLLVSNVQSRYLSETVEMKTQNSEARQTWRGKTDSDGHVFVVTIEDDHVVFGFWRSF